MKSIVTDTYDKKSDYARLSHASTSPSPSARLQRHNVRTAPSSFAILREVLEVLVEGSLCRPPCMDARQDMVGNFAVGVACRA